MYVTGNIHKHLLIFISLEVLHTSFVFKRIVSLFQTDIDYQTDLHNIYAHWGGFYDTHAPELTYKVAVGTKSGLDDVVPYFNVGRDSGIC